MFRSNRTQLDPCTGDFMSPHSPYFGKPVDTEDPAWDLFYEGPEEDEEEEKVQYAFFVDGVGVPELICDVDEMIQNDPFRPEPNYHSKLLRYTEKNEKKPSRKRRNQRKNQKRKKEAMRRRRHRKK